MDEEQRLARLADRAFLAGDRHWNGCPRCLEQQPCSHGWRLVRRYDQVERAVRLRSAVRRTVR